MKGSLSLFNYIWLARSAWFVKYIPNPLCSLFHCLHSWPHHQFLSPTAVVAFYLVHLLLGGTSSPFSVYIHSDCSTSQIRSCASPALSPQVASHYPWKKIRTFSHSPEVLWDCSLRFASHPWSTPIKIPSASPSHLCVSGTDQVLPYSWSFHWPECSFPSLHVSLLIIQSLHDHTV